MQCYLNNLGIINALGVSKAEVLENLFSGSQKNIQKNSWVPNTLTYTAGITAPLPEIPTEFHDYYSRNNQLALHALIQLEADITALKNRFGADRIAVVIGTSTSGIAQAEAAVQAHKDSRPIASDYCYQQIEVGSVAEFAARYLQVHGPAYTISTACSSSGHALKAAKQLLQNNLADVVIAGGVDSLCRLTVNGFSSLESVSDEITNPFSVNRKGINIGEGAALFVVTREAGEQGIALMGVGSSSDAHHISAPEPKGTGAEKAIMAAINEAQLEPCEITYVNLHGTGTKLNDAMESAVTNRLFGEKIPCSSSKAQLGHTLGAAAASEVGLCWLALSVENTAHLLPPHLWDGHKDPALAPLNLVECGTQYNPEEAQAFLSSSFAFGGNNAAVVIGRHKGC